MKILIFHQFYTTSDEPGISRFNLFAKEWQKQGHEVAVVTGVINYITGKKNPIGPKPFLEEHDDNIKLIRTYTTTLGLHYKSFLGTIINYLSFLKSSFWAALIIGGKPDIVIVSSPPIFQAISAYLISRIKKAPLVFEIRDLWPDELIELGGLKNPILIYLSHALEKFLHNKAKHIIVNSPGLKEFLTSKKGVPNKKITVVENPVDFENLEIKENSNPLKQKLKLQDKFIALYSGNHGRVYDFDTLLDVAKHISFKQGQDDPVKKKIHFLLVGDGKKKPHIKERVAKEKIENISLLNPVPKSKIGEYMSLADICLAPLSKIKLLKYVYATKIFDYMSHKKPVIATAEGVNAELIKRSGAGLVSQPGDKETLRKNITRLLNNQKEREALGEKGYHYAKKHLDHKTLAEKYLKVITSQSK